MKMFAPIVKVALFVSLFFSGVFVYGQEPCMTDFVHQTMMENDPLYRQNFLQAQQATDQEVIKRSLPQKGVNPMSGTIYKIPVVIHVLHLGEAEGSGTNISDAQCISAVNSLNDSYRKIAGSYGDGNGVDTEIEFCLASKDPNGNAHSGINRVDASGTSDYSTNGITFQQGTNNEVTIKALSKWDNTKYYNIWAVAGINGNMGGAGVQGYAYFPGAGSSVDGAVMLYNSFGFDPTGSLGYNLKSYTRLNRTCIHEIGHGLGLYHTFEGDDFGNSCPDNNDCTSDGDRICDTPPHIRSASNCNSSGTNSCDGGSSNALFVHNYLDYSSSSCKDEFTDGQKTRMQSSITTYRSNLVSSSNLQASGCDGNSPPAAEFSAATTSPCVGAGVQFSDESTNDPTSWSWTFTPSTVSYLSGTSSSSQNPVVSFDNAGTYTVELTATNAFGNSTETKTNYITTTTASSLPFTEDFESVTFPPTGWNLSSDDAGTSWGSNGGKEWVRKSASGNGSSTAAAAINCFNYPTTLKTDELISPPVDLNNASSPTLTFNVAYRPFSSTNNETLKIYISTDCGNTFGSAVYDKSYQDLATGTELTSSFTPSSAGHWREESIDLSAYTGNDVVIKFESTNGYGNNLYLDDINISETASDTAKVDIAITSGSNPTCSGTSVTFTATPTYGGTTPSYQWQVNESNVGSNSSTYTTSSLSDGDVVTCIMTSNHPGVYGSPDTSNSISMTVNSTVVPSVSIAITSGANPSCDGDNITFTATPTNGGSNPSYQWKVNGSNVGTDSDTYTTSSLSDGDAVTCVLTSDAACASPTIDVSNSINISVTAAITPAVSIAITSGSNPTCSGVSVTFTATPTNGGSSPSYQWKVNGSNVGSNSATYSNSSLNDGDIVTCELTSSETCVTSSTATSNSINMSINSTLIPSLSIALTSGSNPGCSGSSVTFTATPTNGGSSPSYQWKVNGSNVGTDSDTYTTSSLSDGDIVSCELTSSESCASPTTATSNSINMSISSSVAPTVSIAITIGNDSICVGTAVTFTATPTNGGSTPSYQWKVNGSNVGSNSASYGSSALNDGDVVTCELTSSASCASPLNATSNSITMLVSDPTVTVSPSNPTVIQGNSVTLIASGATTYSWTPSATLNTSTNDTVEASPTVATTYTVTGTDDIGCLDQATVTVSINQAVTPSGAFLGVNGGPIDGNNSSSYYDGNLDRNEALRGKSSYWVKKAGIQWFREYCSDGISYSWNFVEPTQGNFDWSVWDLLVEKSQDNGISLLASIGNSVPQWANGSSDWRDKPTDLYSAPMTSTAWYQFVTAIVERYDGDGVDDMPGLYQPIKFWEVWNEPNLIVGGNAHQFDGTVTDFVKILEVAYTAIKAADPSATVVGPGFAGLIDDNRGSNTWQLWQWGDFKDAGGLNYLDIVNYHRYYDTQFGYSDEYEWDHNNILDNELSTVDANRGGKPVWITEIGWNGDYTSDYLDKARNLVRSTVVFWEQSFMDKYFWYSFHESETHEGNNHKGFIQSLNGSAAKGTEPDFLMHQAHTVSNVFNKMLEGFEATDRPVALSVPSNVRAYKFSKGGKDVYVLWKKAGTSGLINTTISTSGKTTVIVDIYGKVVNSSFSGGSIGLGTSPIYLTTDLGWDEDILRITGRVTDCSKANEWNNGVQNVAVNADGPINKTVYTDADGVYLLDSLPEGTYTVTLSAYSGATPTSHTVVVDRDSSWGRISFCIDPCQYAFTVTATADNATLCLEDSTNITASGANSYTWTPSTGLDVDNAAVVKASPSATTTYTITGLDANGCSDDTTVTITVNSPLTPTISISGNDSICEGTSVNFTAAPSHEGSSPNYQWSINGTDVGSNSTSLAIDTLKGGDIVSCRLISSETCVSNDTAYSNDIMMKVVPSVTPTISIALSYGNDTICAGDSVEFTASVSNEGSSPIYSWKLNGNNVGNNSTTFASIALSGGDVITCELTSSATCAVPATLASNAITMEVNPIVSPSLSIAITQGSNPACTGSTVEFTATPQNEGTAPNYQWTLNGNNVGSNSATYSGSSFNDGDLINCTLTSNATCLSSSTATSNNINLNVDALLTPTVSIALHSGNNPACAGSLVEFLASPTHGGSTPSYQWLINGSDAGDTDSLLSTNSLQDGDLITCRLISNEACRSADTVLSDTIIMSIGTVVQPTVSIAISMGNDTVCEGENIEFTAAPVNGGSNPIYQWQINGSNVGSDTTVFSSASLNNGDVITCDLYSNAACASPPIVTSNSISMVVIPTVIPDASLQITSGSIPSCAGKTITFEANGTNISSSATYNWYIDGTLVKAGPNKDYSTASLTNGQEVWCEIVGASACATSNNTFTDTMTATIYATPGQPVISQIGNSDSLMVDIAGAQEYKWYKDGLQITDSTQIIVAGTGTYHVIVKDANGCQSTLSDAFNHISTGIATFESVDLRLFPNPNQGQFVLELPGMNENSRVIIRDVLGQEIHQEMLPAHPQKRRKSFEMSHLAEGIYILEIHTSKGKWLERFLIQ